MNEHDFELLRQFVRRGDQSAFAAIVRRHLDLVYATALRKLEDSGAAEEVAQDVLAALARKAWQFAPDDSLPAWLYRATLLETNRRLRGELRRRRREQTAAELGTTMNTPDQQPALHALVPLLDDALLALRERDRVALLLRYYESRSLREVGAALGVREDAAQKRVAGALERLAQFFRRRGFKTATLAATAAALEHTAVPAPALAASAILQRALPVAPSALAGLKVLLSRFAGLTKIQGAALSLALAAAPVSWQWQKNRAAQHQALAAQATLDAARAGPRALLSDVERLRAESARLTLAAQKVEEAQTEQQEALRQLDALRTRVFGLLSATNYHWPDDLPFVRIPKPAIRQIGPGKGIHAHGKLDNWAAELLALTPEEQQQTQQSLGELTRAMGQLAASRAYETNYMPQRLRYSDWSVYKFKTVAVPPLGSQADSLVNQTFAQLGQSLGRERAQLLIGDALAAKNCPDWDLWVGGCIELASTPQLFTALVNTSSSDRVAVGLFRTGQSGCGGLTGGAPGKNEVTLWGLPDALSSQFFDRWLNQMGLTNAEIRMAP